MRISDWSSDVCSSDLLAQIDLDNTVVRAPIAGVVGNRQVRVGRLVAPGASLLDIVPVADLYVVANFKETQLEHISPGQPVRLRLDGYADVALDGFDRKSVA